VVQQQPLLHQSTISPKGKEQAEEEAPQDGRSANGAEAGSSSEANAESSSKADHWNAVVAAEVNEPVGIITIEDVLEELIGQVCCLCCFPQCTCGLGNSASFCHAGHHNLASLCKRLLLVLWCHWVVIVEICLFLQEILDETDQFVDNEMMHAVNTATLVKNLPPQLRNSLKLRQGLSRSRSGRISITHEGAALTTGNKPSPRRNLSAVRPSSSVTVKRKTGADNQTMDILEPLLQSPSENEK